MERAVPITGQSPPCSAPLDRGNKAQGGPIRMLGSGPEKKRRSLFPLLSTPLLSSPLLSSPPALCPSAQAAEKPSRPSCAGIRMFLGDRQISGLAPVQRERGLVMRIHTLKRYSSEIIHKETRGENVRLFGRFQKKKQKKKREKIRSEIQKKSKAVIARKVKEPFIVFYFTCSLYSLISLSCILLGNLISWEINTNPFVKCQLPFAQQV